MASNSNAQQQQVEEEVHERSRKRLITETGIAVKSLLSTCKDNVVDDNSPQLERFCLLLEKALQHGLKDRSSLFHKTNYWDYLKSLEKLYPPARNSVQNVSKLSHVKTTLGRGRAWIRFALIEKNLHDYLQFLTTSPGRTEALTEAWYEPYALLRAKEHIQMFLGVLAPLSVVDFCLCLKDVPFDSLPTDLGLYVVNKTIDLPSTSFSDTDGDAVASDKAAAMNADSDGDEQQQQVQEQRKEAAQRQLEIVMKETATLRERLAEEQELRIKAEEELQLLHALHKQKEQQQIEEEEEGTPEYNGTVHTTNAEGVVEEEAAEVTELSSSLPLMGKEMLRVSEGVLILRKENERLRGEVAKLKLQLERASEIPLLDATTTPIATTALPLLLEEKEKELQRQYAELTEQNRRKQTSLKNQHDEETRLLRELLQRADEKQNGMTQEIDSLRAALIEREEQLQRQYQQLSDVAKRLEVQQAEAQKLHEIKMLEISSELTALTKRETKEREKKRQHKRRIAELEQELAAADRAKAAASLAPSTRENTQSVSEDTPTNGPGKLEEQQLRLQLAETERQLLDQSTTVELISKTLEVKDEKLLELKAEVKRLLAENEVLQASLQAEKDSIRAEDWTVVEDRTEIENKDREMAQLREALQQQLKDKQDSIQQLEQSLQERSEEVKKLTTLLQSSVQESHELVAGLERKNHALENNLQETKERLAQLTQQRLEEAAQHKAAEQKLKTTIEELESTVATQHEQATILKKLLNMQS